MTKKTNIAISIPEKIKKIEEKLNTYFLEREEVIHAIPLGIISDLNVLLVGSPGTAKTDIIRAWFKHLDMKKFSKTLTPFTIPDEVLGGFSLETVKSGEFKRNIAGKLADCNVALLDEIFKAGAGILNSLLDITHDSRLFSNGSEELKTNILTVLSASNEVPVGVAEVQALYDRMHIKHICNPITEPENFVNMIKSDRKYIVEDEGLILTYNEVLQARKEYQVVTLDEQSYKLLAYVRENMRKANIFCSDRTFHLAVDMLKVEAYLSGKDTVYDTDMEILTHILWKDPKTVGNVNRAVMDTINPELGQLMEMLDKCTKAKDMALKSGNDKDITQAHQQVNQKLDEAKRIKKEMLRKGRDLTKCDIIIKKFVSILSDLALVGYGSRDPNVEKEMFS